MAAWIAESGMAPDLILSSTAVRAVRTAEAVAESCDTQVVYLPELYHAGPHDGFTAMQSAAAYDPEILMWVGHNPGLEAMIDTLTGTFARLPTAALARIDLEIDDWADARPTRLATLVDVWRPREIWTEA
jgi:phosphohistidine phosphatase